MRSRGPLLTRRTACLSPGWQCRILLGTGYLRAGVPENEKDDAVCVSGVWRKSANLLSWIRWRSSGFRWSAELADRSALELRVLVDWLEKKVPNDTSHENVCGLQTEEDCVLFWLSLQHTGVYWFHCVLWILLFPSLCPSTVTDSSSTRRYYWLIRLFFISCSGSGRESNNIRTKRGLWCMNVCVSEWMSVHETARCWIPFKLKNTWSVKCVTRERQL